MLLKAIFYDEQVTKLLAISKICSKFTFQNPVFTTSVTVLLTMLWKICTQNIGTALENPNILFHILNNK